jgi:hypothetical protein
MMKKLIYILLFIGLSGYSQGFDGFLLASQAQFANESAPNVYNWADAADPYNEANSVSSNWVLSSSGGSISSIAASGLAGGYAISLIPTGALGGRVLDFTVDNSSSYKITYYGRSQNVADTTFGDFKAYPYTGGTVSSSSGSIWSMFDNYTYAETWQIITTTATTLGIAILANDDTWATGEEVHIGWIKLEKQ